MLQILSFTPAEAEMIRDIFSFYFIFTYKWHLQISEWVWSFIPGGQTVRWLGEEALRRYQRLRPPSFVENPDEKVLDIRKTAGGAILDPEDHILDVLDDNDFVSIGRKDLLNE